MGKHMLYTVEYLLTLELDKSIFRYRVLLLLYVGFWVKSLILTETGMWKVISFLLLKSNQIKSK